VERRHHLDEKQLQRAMKKAVTAAGIAKLTTPHTLRHYAEQGIVAIPSPHTCWKVETIFARCSNGWAMRMPRRR